MHETLTGFQTHLRGTSPTSQPEAIPMSWDMRKASDMRSERSSVTKTVCPADCCSAEPRRHLRARERPCGTCYRFGNALWIPRARPLNLVREGLDGQAEIAAILGHSGNTPPVKVGMYDWSGRKISMLGPRKNTAPTEPQGSTGAARVSPIQRVTLFLWRRQLGMRSARRHRAQTQDIPVRGRSAVHFG